MRREFLKFTSYAAALLMLVGSLTLSSCKDDDDPEPENTNTNTNTTTTTVAVTDVTLSATTASVTVGGKTTLTATVAPTDATTKTVTWASSDETIATVKDGVVTGVAAGKATITVTTTDGSKTATCEVTVTADAVALTKIELSKTELTLVVGADPETLTYTLDPKNATDVTITWTTSDEAVATVADGKVTPVAAGTATITAESGDVTAECKVTVEAAAEPKEITYDFTGSVSLPKNSTWNYQGVFEVLPSTYQAKAGDKVIISLNGKANKAMTNLKVCLVDNGKNTPNADGVPNYGWREISEYVTIAESVAAGDIVDKKIEIEVNKDASDVGASYCKIIILCDLVEGDDDTRILEVEKDPAKETIFDKCELVTDTNYGTVSVVTEDGYSVAKIVAGSWMRGKLKFSTELDASTAVKIRITAKVEDGYKAGDAFILGIVDSEGEDSRADSWTVSTFMVDMTEEYTTYDFPIDQLSPLGQADGNGSEDVTKADLAKIKDIIIDPRGASGSIFIKNIEFVIE